MREDRRKDRGKGTKKGKGRARRTVKVRRKERREREHAPLVFYQAGLRSGRLISCKIYRRSWRAPGKAQRAASISNDTLHAPVIRFPVSAPCCLSWQLR